jgi:hypothetical protein
MSRQLDEIAKRKEAQRQRNERDLEAREKRAGAFQAELPRYAATKFSDPIAARLRAENETILINAERFEIPQYAGGTEAVFDRISRDARLIVEFLPYDAGDAATMRVTLIGSTPTRTNDETVIEYFVSCSHTGMIFISKDGSKLRESSVVDRIINTFYEYAA